jgi:hypothetical protein
MVPGHGPGEGPGSRTRDSRKKVPGHGPGTRANGFALSATQSTPSAGPQIDGLACRGLGAKAVGQEVVSSPSFVTVFQFLVVAATPSCFSK